MPDARHYAGQGAKDMPHARHALAVRARDGEIWAASRDDAASPASGSIRLGPPLRQKPVGQGALRLRESYHCETSCMILESDGGAVEIGG